MENGTENIGSRASPRPRPTPSVWAWRMGACRSAAYVCIELDGVARTVGRLWAHPIRGPSAPRPVQTEQGGASLRLLAVRPALW